MGNIQRVAQKRQGRELAKDAAAEEKRIGAKAGAVADDDTDAMQRMARRHRNRDVCSCLFSTLLIHSG